MSMKHSRYVLLSISFVFLMVSLSTFLIVSCGTDSAPRSTYSKAAPDASDRGQYSVRNDEFYKFQAVCDDQVLPCSREGEPPDTERFVELWGHVYRPDPMEDRPHPLIVMLHGNHGTCGKPADDIDKLQLGVPLSVSFHVDHDVSYTMTGTCDEGMHVVGSHLGYGYLAERLASHGYVVVSVNAERGINAGEGMEGDEGLIFARGRLVLSHLRLLNRWNDGDRTDIPPNSEGRDLPMTLEGKLDFGNVGLFGHSRGGEGVRAAYVLYRDGDPGPYAPNWKAEIPRLVVKGLFETAPTDFGVLGISGPPLAPEGPLNAEGTAWNVLLPVCDCDVSNLSGVRVFDRMLSSHENPFEAASPAPKSTYTVWGANHNYFNTEWQTSDSAGCIGIGNHPLFTPAPGSEDLMAVGLSSVLAFFRGSVGDETTPGYDSAFRTAFNPLYDLPTSVVYPCMTKAALPTRIDRGYTTSPAMEWHVEDFSGPEGMSSHGVANESAGVVVHYVTGSIRHTIDCPEAYIPPLIIPDHNPSQRAASISWQGGGSGVYFQTNVTEAGAPGVDITTLPTPIQAGALSFRVARKPRIASPIPITNVEGKCELPSPIAVDPLNTTTETNFSIALVGADNTITDSVEVAEYLAPEALSGPVGVLSSGDSAVHPILQTVRIPLSSFIHFEKVKHQFRGVRFIFDKTGAGAIYVANIVLDANDGPPLPPAALVAEKRVNAGSVASDVSTSIAGSPSHDPSVLNRMPGSTSVSDIKTAKITSIRRVNVSRALHGAPAMEIEITSDTPFPSRNDLLTLAIGGETFHISRYTRPDQTSVVFTIPLEDFSRLVSGSPVSVGFSRMNAGTWWDTGKFEK